MWDQLPHTKALDNNCHSYSLTSNHINPVQQITLTSIKFGETALNLVLKCHLNVQYHRHKCINLTWRINIAIFSEFTAKLKPNESFPLYGMSCMQLTIIYYYVMLSGTDSRMILYLVTPKLCFGNRFWITLAFLGSLLVILAITFLSVCICTPISRSSAPVVT